MQRSVVAASCGLRFGNVTSGVTWVQGEERQRRRDTYPSIDDTFHDFGVCLCGKVQVLELGFHREDDIVKPLQELVLLARSEIWELGGMLSSVGQTGLDQRSKPRTVWVSTKPGIKNSPFVKCNFSRCPLWPTLLKNAFSAIGTSLNGAIWWIPLIKPSSST